MAPTKSETLSAKARAVGEHVVVRLKLIDLTDEDIRGRVAGAQQPPIHSIVDACALIDPVEAGKPLEPEDVAFVEIECLAVLSGIFSGLPQSGAATNSTVGSITCVMNSLSRIKGNRHCRLAWGNTRPGIARIVTPSAGSFKVGNMITVRPKSGRKGKEIADGTEEWNFPSEAAGQPLGVVAFVAGEDRKVHVHRGAATELVGPADEIVVGHGKDEGQRVLIDVRIHGVEGISVGDHVVPSPEPLGEHTRGQGPFVAEIVFPQIGPVGGAVDIQAGAPSVVDVVKEVAENVTARRVRRIVRDAALEQQFAARQPMAILGLQQGTLVGGEGRRQGQIAIGVIAQKNGTCRTTPRSDEIPKSGGRKPVLRFTVGSGCDRYGV